MLRDLGGLFWRDDGHGLVVHVLLPLVRVRLEEGLSFVVVEELGVQLSAFLRLLRGLQLQDVDLLWFTLWLIGNWRSFRGVLMSVSVIIVIVIEAIVPPLTHERCFMFCLFSFSSHLCTLLVVTLSSAAKQNRSS